MKKTIIINIGNTIIHIEEDAYEVLTNYLNEIKQHFAKNAEDFEIVTDIENRIAEMFSEMLHQATAKVVNLAQVQTVMAQMGTVADISGDGNESDLNNEEHQYTGSGDKKLFRDSDDATIAGVCSGLAYFLNLEVRWVRVIALLSICLGGAGILAYLILWIAIPRAITRADKMEMRGESINLVGYKRSFEEELAAFKQRMRAEGANFKGVSGFVSEVTGATGRAFNALGRGIAKILATLIVIAGFCFMVALVVGLAFMLGFVDADEAYQYFPFSIINEEFRAILMFAAFVVFFIPILALVLYSIRVAFNKATINKTLSFTLLIIWLAGVCIGVYGVAKISSEFKEHAELVQTSNMKSFSTYVIDADPRLQFSREDSLLNKINDLSDGNIADDLDDDRPFRIPKNVYIEIERSDSNETSLVQHVESQGKNFEIALRNARNISYKVSQFENRLVFPSRLRLKTRARWRNQEVHVILRVPVGTKFKINRNVGRYLYFNNFDCNWNDYDADQYSEWLMTADGLRCLETSN